MISKHTNNELEKNAFPKENINALITTHRSNLVKCKDSINDRDDDILDKEKLITTIQSEMLHLNNINYKINNHIASNKSIPQ